MRTCSVPGCGRAHYARTWCKRHYSRWETNGDTAAHIPIGGHGLRNIPTGTRVEGGFYRAFMANVACWQNEINARLVLGLYERRDAARDQRDSSITAWDGDRWILIR